MVVVWCYGGAAVVMVVVVDIIVGVASFGLFGIVIDIIVVAILCVNQVSGETKYLDDTPLIQGELHAAFVVSNQGNARVAAMDPSEALVCLVSPF